MSPLYKKQNKDTSVHNRQRQIRKYYCDKEVAYLGEVEYFLEMVAL